MKAVIQRVSQASVTVDHQVVAKISPGFLVLLGIAKDDTQSNIDYLVKKITYLRIISDNQGKMNLSLKDVNGQMLIVSQFTLLANTDKGNRPSFVPAADPKKAKKLYQLFIQQVKAAGIKVQTGIFGAAMQVSLINDGPVTIVLDAKR